MRKDFMADTAAHDEDETSFVERYWTEVWVREGGPKGKIDAIPNKEEFRIMRPYLDALPRGALIVDGGCGLGDWVLALARRGFDALGLDISRATVAQLQARFPEARFQVADIRGTELPSDSVDAYFSWGVFEHFEAGPSACIAETYRILKPGGVAFISTPMDNLRQAVLGSFRRPRPDDGQARRFYQYRFTRAELAAELARGGFDILEARPIHKRQGVLRMLHHEFGLPYHWFFTRGLAAALALVLPGVVIGHMVMCIVRKPVGHA